jgi:hypothetical protein
MSGLNLQETVDKADELRRRADSVMIGAAHRLMVVVPESLDEWGKEEMGWYTADGKLLGLSQFIVDLVTETRKGASLQRKYGLGDVENFGFESLSAFETALGQLERDWGGIVTITIDKSEINRWEVSFLSAQTRVDPLIDLRRRTAG